MTIKKLPDTVISRIAAGEVIAAPANAVKELLENSLDANSTSISIFLSKKNTDFTIRDNGDGIEKEDLEFLCLNHYTSKLDTIDIFKNSYQLATMSTFGFRGEALHSLSLCSHLKVYTKCNPNQETGYMATYYNGNMTELKETAYNEKGSTFEVKNIFYNNLIRASYFEKNKNSYLSALEIVKCYGIIFNSIECFLDNKVIIKMDSSVRSIPSEVPISLILANRKKYIYENFISEFSSMRQENLIQFNSEKFNFMCSDATVNLKRTKFILFVNKRLVKDTNLLTKILGKYKKVKSGIYPFIFIEITTDHVDVNVHPEKAKVFIENEFIYDEIVNKIGEALVNNSTAIFFEEKFETGNNQKRFCIKNNDFPEKYSKDLENKLLDNSSDIEMKSIDIQDRREINFQHIHSSSIDINKDLKPKTADIDFNYNKQSFEKHNLSTEIDKNLNANPDTQTLKNKKTFLNNAENKKLECIDKLDSQQSVNHLHTLNNETESFSEYGGEITANPSEFQQKNYLEFDCTLNSLPDTVTNSEKMHNKDSLISNYNDSFNLDASTFKENGSIQHYKHQLNSSFSSLNSSKIQSSPYFSSLKDNSPFKIYSSSTVRRLDEQNSLEPCKNRKKFSLKSLKELQSELVGNDPDFFRNLVFVGVYENFIFAQHQLNLIKIERQKFLFQAFYQKFVMEFGNFECLELDMPFPTTIPENLHELLREYFSIYIESGSIIAIPKIFDLNFQFDITEFKIEKLDETRTIRQICEQLAKIYSKLEVDVKIFNKIKTEVISTVEIIESLSLLIDLKEIYKGFDRC